MKPDIRSLSVGALTRVEGEGALNITLRDGRVEQVELNIYEPPRFFEAFLRGRSYAEAPDITARICGICPVAYQVSACNAIENACGVVIPEQLSALRRLLYCGEWIHSHALHIFLLHAPDFFGHPDAIALAKAEPSFVECGLAIKNAGSRLMEQIGGRAIHPVNVRLGGFYSVPEPADLEPLSELLRGVLDDAVATVERVSGFEFPEIHFDHEYLALTDGERYPIENGAAVCTRGAAFPATEFDRHVIETQVAHSTALHAKLDGERYLTGPMARFALNSSRLSPIASQLADSSGALHNVRNPFYSIVIRAIEMVYAIEEALRIIAAYERPQLPFVDVPPQAGVGIGVSEAPRGLLYHRYQLTNDGLIQSAKIVPPTSQNQGAIEYEISQLALSNISLGDAALTELCERAIRNHDPCISCAAHFLKLSFSR